VDTVRQLLMAAYGHSVRGGAPWQGFCSMHGIMNHMGLFHAWLFVSLLCLLLCRWCLLVCII